MVILLAASPRGRLQDLQIDRYRHSLRKRLVRAGLAHVSVVGGFEMIYRARSKDELIRCQIEPVLAFVSVGIPRH